MTPISAQFCRHLVCGVGLGGRDRVCHILPAAQRSDVAQVQFNESWECHARYACSALCSCSCGGCRYPTERCQVRLWSAIDALSGPPSVGGRHRSHIRPDRSDQANVCATTRTQPRSFLGMCNYFRDSVAKLRPITKVLSTPAPSPHASVLSKIGSSYSK